ncbi:MAG: RSP_7527 family protein [Alkalilacustris sp.]
MNPQKTPQSEPTQIYFELPDPIDMVAIERRAREMRAQAFSDGVVALGRWAARCVAALRLPAGSRTA